MHDDTAGKPQAPRGAHLKGLESPSKRAAIREEEKVEQILELHRQVTQGGRQQLEVGNSAAAGYQTIDAINKEVATEGKDKAYQTIEGDGTGAEKGKDLIQI